MAAKAQPEGYFTVTPNLVVDGASQLIEFLKATFGATERMRMEMPGGKIAHAEYMIGDSPIMISDASDTNPAAGAYVHVYVDDSDAVYKKALANGATPIMEPETMFYGDRAGNVKDRWGNRWTISTHVEDVSEEETAKRMKEMSFA